MDDIAKADPCYECPWQKSGCTCPILKPVIDKQAEQIRAKDEEIARMRAKIEQAKDYLLELHPDLRGRASPERR